MPFAPGDIARVTKRMDGLSREFSGKAMADDMAKLGKIVAHEVDVAVRSTPSVSGSLADGSMSGWRRGAPITVSGKSFPHRSVTSPAVTIAPGRTVGLMRVLEDGRSGRGAQQRVSFRTLKSGVVKARKGKVLRAAGATEGKGTWTRAEKLMESSVRKMMPVMVARKFRRISGL